MHYMYPDPQSYQTKVRTGSDLQRDIMNHTAVVHGSSFVKDAVVFLNNLDLPIPLALAEVGSVLGGANASQNNALAAVFGSALWQVDFSLYSMSIGVQRINWQSGLGFPFALWNPQYEHNGKTVPASVHPAFYGHIFVGEFVGKTGNTRVKHLELGKPFLAGYAAYDAGKLARIVFVNLELWSEGDGERLEKKITLDVGVGVSEVSIKRLTSKMGGTARVGNITWGGVQWTVGNGGKEVEVLNDTTTVPVNRGMVEIGIKPSEAVMIQLSG
ncbi:hypothetical protein SLS60_006096 [Paraconiothyrium brasiliense]|uniref:Beta-glucuronidase C-terminal domain-containing protein n=1 Tax=Paraconiothyrium brasiliense TaxID=300254 RepID=A0ABR3RE22_9PLEO